MHERLPSSLSKKKEVMIASEEFLLGYAAMVPPIFVAGLLFNIPLEKFETHEKTVILSFLLLIGVVNAGVERYKRENPSSAQSYDWPDPVKIIDLFFAATTGFGSVAINFLALAIYEGFQTTVQKFHWPILILALIYTILVSIKTISDKNALTQSSNPERQALLRRNSVNNEGFLHDMNVLMDYMNNALFPAAFQIAPIEFVVDAFNKLTLPAFVSLFALTIFFSFARGSVYHFKRNHPEMNPKSLPAWIKAIELVCKTNDSFGLFVIPILVLNSFFPLNEIIIMIGVTMAVIYSALSTINKIDDLRQPNNNLLVNESNEDVGFWQSVKNTATSCCGFFSSDRSNSNREMLDSPLDGNNLRPPRLDNPLYDRTTTNNNANGYLASIKKAATNCFGFFSSTKKSHGDSDTTPLLDSRAQPLNRHNYLATS